MKIVAKINRGLILTVAVIIVLACYLAAQAISQNSAKPEIKEICEGYIKTATAYTMLPEQYRIDKPDISANELNSYIEEMTTDLKKYYPNDEQIYKYQLQTMQNSLEKQATGAGVIFTYAKKTLSYDVFNFDGDSVTVTLTTNSSFDGYDDSIASSQRIIVTADTKDTISLKKIDGSWKVIYANLAKPTNSDNLDNTIKFSY